MLSQICLVFIHVLQCTPKIVHAKFGGHRCCKTVFRAIILFSNSGNVK